MDNPIDKKLAQQIVATVKDVCGQNVNFIDHTGIIYASTDEKRIGSFMKSENRPLKRRNAGGRYGQPVAGTQKGVNLPIFHNGSLVAVIGISGPPDQVRKYAYLAERITILLIRERELNTFSRTQAEKMHYVIHSLINRENLSQAYLLDTLEHFKISRNGRYRLLQIHIHSGRSPMNTAEAEQKIQRLFSRTDITLYTFNFPSEYLAVADSRRFPVISPILEEFAVSQKGLLKIAVGKSCPIFQLSESGHTGTAAMKALHPPISGIMRSLTTLLWNLSWPPWTRAAGRNTSERPWTRWTQRIFPCCQPILRRICLWGTPAADCFFIRTRSNIN